MTCDVIDIVINPGYSLRQRDEENATLLQKAVHGGTKSLVTLLLEKGANVNVKGAYGYTALHECCYLGDATVLVIVSRVLLFHDGNTLFSDTFSNTLRLRSVTKLVGLSVRPNIHACLLPTMHLTTIKIRGQAS